MWPAIAATTGPSALPATVSTSAINERAGAPMTRRVVQREDCDRGVPSRGQRLRTGPRPLRSLRALACGRRCPCVPQPDLYVDRAHHGEMDAVALRHGGGCSLAIAGGAVCLSEGSEAPRQHGTRVTPAKNSRSLAQQRQRDADPTLSESGSPAEKCPHASVRVVDALEGVLVEGIQDRIDLREPTLEEATDERRDQGPVSDVAETGWLLGEQRLREREVLGQLGEPARHRKRGKQP